MDNKFTPFYDPEIAKAVTKSGRKLAARLNIEILELEAKLLLLDNTRNNITKGN